MIEESDIVMSRGENNASEDEALRHTGYQCTIQSTNKVS